MTASNVALRKVLHEVKRIALSIYSGVYDRIDNGDRHKRNDLRGHKCISSKRETPYALIILGR